MYKIFLVLLLAGLLNAELINGVAIVVKGEAITLYDIKEEMRKSKLNLKDATDVLVRKTLEDVEVKERNIKVSSSEVYDDIKQTAAKNNMSVSDFYAAVRESNGLSSMDLKDKTREKLLSQKLYSSIAYSSVSQPSDTEIKEYFELHKSEFSHPAAFNVIIYTAQDKALLQQKISSPMFYSPAINEDVQTLPYERINPELAQLLEAQKVNTFSQIIPNGNGASMTFYLKGRDSVKEVEFDGVKNQITNIIMAKKREQVLSDYFARLQGNAEIKVLREVK